jgi:hypothetical protein
VVEATDYEIKKALVGLAIEQSLREMGKTEYANFIQSLYEEYRCYVPDCYDHPEYLNKILRDRFGIAHAEVVESIKKRLEEFALQKPIENFLTKITR